MTFLLKKQTSWIWLLCIVFLAVRIGGAHLHLCFDGEEPPFSVHAGESTNHDEHDGIHHADTDLNLLDSASAKTFVKIQYTPALIAALIVLCVHLVVRRLAITTYSPPLFRFIPPRFTAPRAPPR